MASTYSPLKIELIGTGEQVATWGQTTNTNLGTAIEQAIGGKADVTMSSTSVTLTLTDTNALQNARALYLNLTGTPGGAATLNVPAVQKAYIVRNGTTGGFAVTVKVTGQTGVSVPNGATMHLYNNGTDVVNAMTNLPAGATVGGVAIGTGGGSVTSVTGTGTVNGITLSGNITSSGSLTLGGALTNVDLTTQVTNTLPTNRGGTGQTVTQYCSLTTNVNGTLPVANGGTGATTLTANAALIGNGTGAVLGLSPGVSGNIMSSNGSTWVSQGLASIVAPGANGNVLTSNGTTWASAALPTGFVAGMIMMWAGTIATIPTGWVLCNGSNGTPDLRDRFIIGASQDSGGVARTNVTGSLTQTGGSKDSIVVSHTHTASSSVTDPGHTHTANIQNEILQGGPFSTVRPVAAGTGTIGMTTSTTGVTVSTSVSSTGSSGTNANLPPYYALAFIMKT
jgi:hypothetical protein